MQAYGTIDERLMERLMLSDENENAKQADESAIFVPASEQPKIRVQCLKFYAITAPVVWMLFILWVRFEAKYGGG